MNGKYEYASERETIKLSFELYAKFTEHRSSNIRLVPVAKGLNRNKKVINSSSDGVCQCLLVRFIFDCSDKFCS